MPKLSEKRKQHLMDLVEFDRSHSGFGVSLAGMDEAGRGPLVGNVVAACVIMPPEPIIEWIDDSKKLSALRRNEVFDEISKIALYIGVGMASPEEIDAVNILNATKLAMTRAAADAPATLCIVDAVNGLHLPFPCEPIIRGDATSYQVAAASIIAKVTRDRQMMEYAKKYPQYGFDHNMGYGTKEHYEALQTYGLTPQHRKSFLKNLIGESDR